MRIVIAIPWCRWPPTMALPTTQRAQQMGPQRGNNQKTYKMVGNILDKHFLSILVSVVYAHARSIPSEKCDVIYFFKALRFFCWGPWGAPIANAEQEQ